MSTICDAVRSFAENHDTQCVIALCSESLLNICVYPSRATDNYTEQFIPSPENLHIDDDQNEKETTKSKFKRLIRFVSDEEAVFHLGFQSMMSRNQHRNFRKRQLKRKLAQCSYNRCHANGSLSCSKQYGINYIGRDKELLFCPNHFLELMVIYSEYKDLEKSQICLRMHVADVVLLFKKEQIQQTIKVLQKIIALRELFQSKIDVPESQCDGHCFWIQSLNTRSFYFECALYGHFEQIKRKNPGQVRRRNTTWV